MPIPKIEARSSTMSQRLGFHDPDLTSPEHDAMVFWVKNHLRKNNRDTNLPVLKEIDEIIIQNNKALDHINDYLDNIEDRNPIVSELRIGGRQESEKVALAAKYQIEKVDWDKIKSELEQNILKYKFCNISLETAITSSKSFIVGYADIEFVGRTEIYFAISTYKYFSYYTGEIGTRSREKINIEVKPKIQSFGELIRQINTYRVHNSFPWYVACPDDRHKDNLADENIGFIHITEDYKEYL